MSHFTKEEQSVLFGLALIVFVGTSLHFVVKTYPPLKDIMNFIDSDHIYDKVDLNTASLEELVSIPYIGRYTAGNIINYREEKGLFTSVSQVQFVKGIKKQNYDKFSKYLKVAK